MHLVFRASQSLRRSVSRWATPGTYSLAIAIGLFSPLTNGDPGRVVGAGSAGPGGCTTFSTTPQICGSVSGLKCTKAKQICVTVGSGNPTLQCGAGQGGVATACLNDGNCLGDNNDNTPACN